MNIQKISIALIGLLMLALALIAFNINPAVQAQPDDHDHDEHEMHSEETPEGDTHDDHEDPDDHADHADEGLIERLAPQQQQTIGLTVATAQLGHIENTIALTGEVSINEDRIAHLVPRVAGVVQRVDKNLGDTVAPNEVIAVLESRELADLKSNYLAVTERLTLAQTNFEREQKLWEKKIVPEQDFLEARQALAEAEIEQRAAERQLHALGFSQEYIRQLPEQSHEKLTRYELKAPFAGEIVEKHIVPGELVTEESTVFVVADLSTVWINLSLHPRDLPYVRKGQMVDIQTLDGQQSASGEIAYIAPALNADTRTSLARTIVPNPDGLWKSGLFVTAVTGTGHQADHETLVVDRAAVQMMGEDTIVFVVTDEGYLPRSVQIGASDAMSTEIVQGLAAGERYVSDGAFELKARLVTQTMDSHAGHGH